MCARRKKTDATAPTPEVMGENIKIAAGEDGQSEWGSTSAEELYDERIRAVKSLSACPTEEKMWVALVLFAGHPFTTAKGLEFTYTVRGNEVFFSRKEKSVTRATVDMAFERALELQKPDGQGRPGTVSGPKKLGVFGASYIYPVFMEIGVIEKPKKSKKSS